MTSTHPADTYRTNLVELIGEDARTFAHAQFGSDVEGLAVGDAQWSAWLDPQGRARHVFALACVEAHRFVAWLPLGGAASMARDLARYLLRSRVTVRDRGDQGHLLAPAVVGAGPAVDLPLLPGWRLQVDAPAVGFGATVDDLPASLALAGIDAGLPWLDARLACEFTAAALGLSRIGATRLDKGCYPGQEIVARLHYRGGNKRHCLRLRVDATKVPPPGTRILHAGAACGTMLYAAARESHSMLALAVVDESALSARTLNLDGGATAEALGVP
ncbi:hypothetical protein [Dokdonella sp.]|uniref:CAF17-like 4Fe-4S cluster assembly/insertion protein YgfZ n=1 Tax=Dokdonella sp. TaxID=2291710 RepID=UPI0025B994DB|nr:hypothetical protein [Dokdonella sp.]MBX3692600.1 hypothetical protein [Dokdonella sp.]